MVGGMTEQTGLRSAAFLDNPAATGLVYGQRLLTPGKKVEMITINALVDERFP
jgi:hypothetical protein